MKMNTLKEISRDISETKAFRCPQTSLISNQTSLALFLHILVKCSSKEIAGRIECGWLNITEEHCLARDCCYDSAADGLNTGKIICFVKPHRGKKETRVFSFNNA